jgi:hypothetical protein
LILDGPVDLTVSGVEFYREQAQAFNEVLVMALQACSTDEACAADMGGDALAAYDGLAARMAQSSFPFDFPLPSGGQAERSLTFSDLETAAASYMYSETARMIFLRALAAAMRDDLVPLARVVYDSLYLDPGTMEPVPDPSYSDAVYYGVECNDYEFGSPTTTYRRRNRYRHPRWGRSSRRSPCVFWPVEQVDRARPAGLARWDPTLVLVGTADPPLRS